MTNNHTHDQETTFQREAGETLSHWMARIFVAMYLLNTEATKQVSLTDPSDTGPVSILAWSKTGYVELIAPSAKFNYLTSADAYVPPFEVCDGEMATRCGLECKDTVIECYYAYSDDALEAAQCFCETHDVAVTVVNAFQRPIALLKPATLPAFEPGSKVRLKQPTNTMNVYTGAISQFGIMTEFIVESCAGTKAVVFASHNPKRTYQFDLDDLEPRP